MNAPRPLPVFEHHGLASLWDMLEICATNFHLALNALNALEGKIEDGKGLGADMSKKFEYVDDLLVHIQVFIRSIDGLEVSNTMAASKRFEITLATEKPSIDEVYANLVDIRKRFKDELMDCMFLGITAQETHEYRETLDMFEIEVGEIFCTKVEEDIEEAGKCLALDRNTACVFHLMRAMEQVLKHLAAKLEIQNVDKEWGKLLSEIDGKIQAMPKGKERDEWSECRANLYHVKQAWRNSTMHPKETYTNEQARKVLRAVQAFMEQLATLV